MGFSRRREGGIAVNDAQALAGFAGTLGIKAETGSHLVGRGKGFAHIVHNAGR